MTRTINTTARGARSTVRGVLVWCFVGVTIAFGLMGHAQAWPVTVQDDRGRSVELPAPPKRIVSLLPSLTESVCALDACDRLVGVDRYSRYPESVLALPILGGGLDPNIEAVVGRKPDVVLISVASRASQRLEALGLKVVALEPKTHADVQRVLLVLDWLLHGSPQEGSPAPSKAEQVWQTIDEGVNAAARSLPAGARGLRVYFEVSRGPYGAGPQSFIGETLARLGLGNVLPDDLGPFPRVTPEYILRADPDVLMVSSRSMVPEFQYPGWKNMRAMQAGHVCQFDSDEANILVRPGPRMHEAAHLMADCVARWYTPFKGTEQGDATPPDAVTNTAGALNAVPAQPVAKP